MAFHELTIREVRRETPDAVAVTFDLPEAPADVFTWQAGQHLNLCGEVDGEQLRRSYSIVSTPGGPLTVGIRKVEGGRFSAFAQMLKPGDRLMAMPPDGRFTPKGETDILLIAAGSGITPIIAIASEALARGARATLVYGNRDMAHIMFREALNALKDRYLSTFTLIHVLSREAQDAALLNGRVTGEKLANLARAGAIDFGTVEGVYICGPGEMIEDVSETCAEAGMNQSLIHHERFTNDGETPRPASRAAQAAATAGVAVEVLLDGRRRLFRLEDKDASLIEAAARAGLELPYSCRGGMCCTCRCRVVEGSTEMALNYSLEPWEIEAGFTLACQSRPTSEKLVLDFDAA